MNYEKTILIFKNYTEIIIQRNDWLVSFYSSLKILTFRMFYEKLRWMYYWS